MQLIQKFALPLLMLLIVVQPTAAQPPHLPIVISTGGNLYFLSPEGESTQLTNNLTSGDGTLDPTSGNDLFPSPNNTHLIWRDTPQFFEDAFNNGELGNIGTAPADLYMLNLETREITTIASHGDVASSAGVRWVYREQRHMSWSPDGTQFAYLEAEGGRIDPNDVRLYVYDLATGESRLLKTPVPQGDLAWLDSGIVIHRLQSFWLYSPEDGSLLADTTMSTLFTTLFVPNPVWVDGKAYIGIQYLGEDLPDERGMTKLFDPLTGDYFAAGGVLAGVAAAAPETSLRLMGGVNDNRAYAIRTVEGEDMWTRPTQPPYATDLSLSPDGSHFALSLLSTPEEILFGDAEGFTPLEYSAWGMDWGALLVTVVTLDAPALAPLLDAPLEGEYTVYMCGIAAPSPLTAGEQGRVLPGGANRLRAEPSLDAEQIGEIPSGETFTVLQGRQGVCRNNIRWARVEYNGVIGWTAENLGENMFVESVS